MFVCLSVRKDLAFWLTDMIKLYSVASHKFWEVLTVLGEGTTTLPREIAPIVDLWQLKNCSGSFFLEALSLWRVVRPFPKTFLWPIESKIVTCSMISEDISLLILSGILRDKTTNDKFMYIPSDARQRFAQ